MWIVMYDRHYKDALYKTSTYETEKYWQAWTCYKWWGLCYFLSTFPVKRLTLHKYENGVFLLKAEKGTSKNLDQLRRIKYGRRSKYYN